MAESDKKEVIGQMLKEENIIEGISWPPFVTQEALDAIREYDIRDDDVWVVTYPKSGTIWVREIVRLIKADGQIDVTNPEQTPDQMEFGICSDGREPMFKRTQEWKSPRTITTHVVEHLMPKQIYEGKGKVIYVTRNPKDNAVSWWHHLKLRQRQYDFAEWTTYLPKYCNGEVPYGSWFTHNKEYWSKHKNDTNFLFVKYEDLKKDLRAGVVQMSDFLGHPLSNEAIDLVVEHTSLENMRQWFQSGSSTKPTADDTSNPCAASPLTKVGPPKIIRKGIVGDWKTQFTVAQNEEFDEFYQKEMDNSGITLAFE